MRLKFWEKQTSSSDELENELKHEKTKPKIFLLVKTKHGRVIKTAPCEPYILENKRVVSSLSAAKEKAKLIIKSVYVDDKIIVSADQIQEIEFI